MRMTLDALPVGASAVVDGAALHRCTAPPDARPRLRAGLVRPRSARFPPPVERPGRLRCARRGHRAAARGRGRRADRNALIFQEGSPHAERGAHHCSGGKPERGKIHRVQHPHRAAAAHGQLAGKLSPARGDLTYGGERFTLVDLPGTYSLFPNSAEEEIARDYLCSGEAEAVLILADATCLERSLNLVLQKPSRRRMFLRSCA